ncbi:kinase-like domain-containing protein [Roridomyces roridus]|uniref:Kinase-like domain-containing protein n=1 Tax=Roridomyces roridus TaxID=1738132 RepID=A0AAD7BRV0_9AGAR|nr:kinase-like domain-containing protein [Roridomyces roridus]
MEPRTHDYETIVTPEGHGNDDEDFILPGVFRNCGSKSGAHSYSSSVIPAPEGITVRPSSALFCHPHDPEPRSDMSSYTCRFAYGIPTPISELPSVSATPAIVPPSNAHVDPQEICFGDPVLSLTRPPDRIVVLDRYSISSGGSCNVYRASFQVAGRELLVAIKLLRTSKRNELGRVLKKLHREEGLWKTIRHPNILPFFGLHDIEASEIQALVSPFCKFGQIREYLSDHPGANRNVLVHGVAAGLSFLHSREIIHGDIKPENIVIDKRSNPCICDFGISRIMDCRGFTTITVGTLAYMAPELFTVVHGQAWTEPSRTTTGSDAYSFALLALEILAEEELKDRPNSPFLRVEDLERHRPKLPDYSGLHVSEALRHLLQRCWQLEPQTRPSMIEMLAQTPASGHW